ncbi:MAG: hypothetical protein EOP24_13115 [Hyphomicrobiales bacterium]|nr:MAG: hypothetical protein EOP24_13115 [Hyphomicrobiales bacterium]
MNDKVDTVPAKKRCFVIGPIGDPGSEIRRNADMLYHAVIEPVVGERYLLSRADLEQKSGMITDVIIQRVNDSDLVIADLTTLNPNVFYELGIRHAAQKPTIHIAARPTKLPFDNAGYSTILLDLQDWFSQSEAKRELGAQVTDTERPDFKATNPVTQAITMKAFNASPDTEEKAIANIGGRVAALENMVNQLRRPIASTRKSDDDVDLDAEVALLASRVQDRRSQLASVVSTVEQQTGNTYSEDAVKRFIRTNTDTDENFRDIVNKVRRGDLGAIAEELDRHSELSRPPFGAPAFSSDADDDIPF